MRCCLKTLSVDRFVFGGQSFSAKISKNSVTIESDKQTESLSILFDSDDVSSVNVKLFDGNKLVNENCVNKNALGKTIINENAQPFTKVIISY